MSDAEGFTRVFALQPPRTGAEIIAMVKDRIPDQALYQRTGGPRLGVLRVMNGDTAQHLYVDSDTGRPIEPKRTYDAVQVVSGPLERKRPNEAHDAEKTIRAVSHLGETILILFKNEQ
jgi:hypothetical protein